MIYFLLLTLFVFVEANSPTLTETAEKRIIFSSEVIEPPEIPHREYTCGYPHSRALHYASLDDENKTSVDIYYLNVTAERLEREGFEVTVMEMSADAITNMTYTNGSDSGSFSFSSLFGISSTPIPPVARQRAQYMVQIGINQLNKTQFVCYGVLINRQWVVTTAHCLKSRDYKLNLVRLGDFDLLIPVSEPENRFGKKIVEYPIDDVILHPDYDPDSGKDDLALIKLPQKTPQFHRSINPICLPWGNITTDLIGKRMFLTGWNTENIDKNVSQQLQEIVVNVSDPSICTEKQEKESMTGKDTYIGDADSLICAKENLTASEEITTCIELPGAPIAFNVKSYSDPFVLFGLLSESVGCGQDGNLGVFLPLNKPKYLKWIKDVAFSDNIAV